MKQIELTEEHKSKLLEMCRKLFPEYEIHFELEDIYYDGKNYFVEIQQDQNNIWEYIHWFEFCITTLATKIWNESSQIRQKWGTITMFRGILCQEVAHPIDYLYEQFKKL